MIARATFFAACLAAPALALADPSSGPLSGPLSGAKTASLIAADGTATPVADIVFSEDADGASYEIEMRAAPFTDHFLSMRPFKCLEGALKHWCHVPYPYEIKRVATPEDLTDLEYDLLFIWKGASEYGINMWNGVYYRLELDGDRLVGRLHEIDMDTLSAPPDDGDLRPVREQDLEEGDPDSHWLPIVVIE